MFATNRAVEGNVMVFVFKDYGDGCMYVCTMFNLYRKKLCILNMSTAAFATEICPDYSKSIWCMTQHCQRLLDGTQFQFYGTV